MNDDEPTVVRDREVVSSQPSESRPPAYRHTEPGVADYVARIVKVLFAIVQALLVLRIALLLLMANQNNAIVQAILTATDPIVRPFVNMFSTNVVRAGSGSILDIPAIVALVAWSIVEWLVLLFLGIFGRGGADAPS